MKFAFALPNSVRVKALTQPWELDVTGADQTLMARRAEELGYDMIPVPEHFVVPNSHVELSGPHYFHSTVAQAYLAGATQRIRINSFVTLLPPQHPVVMAKALSTADWMSSGRITVTFGVGWDAEEFRILGVPFRERGRIADEYLAAILELWTSDSPKFEGKYVTFKDVAFEPKPVQKPHPPIWIGGDAEPVLKRAARYASGWPGYVAERPRTRRRRRPHPTTAHERAGNHRPARSVLRARRDDHRGADPAGEARRRLPRLRAVGHRGNQATCALAPEEGNSRDHHR